MIGQPGGPSSSVIGRASEVLHARRRPLVFVAGHLRASSSSSECDGECVRVSTAAAGACHGKLYDR